MNLSDSEKRILYQADGYDKSEVLSELRFGISYMPKPEQREAARSLIHKLESIPDKECLELIQDIRKNYRVPGGPKTIGELLAEARQKSGAERLKGHDIMALERFDDTTRHMIIFDVLSSDALVGDKGDKMRLFLTDAGYLIEIRGYGLVDAVNRLTGGEVQTVQPFQKPEALSRPYREPERKPFSLPWAKRCATFMVSYLQRRGISSEVISRSFRLGLLYEANYKGEAVCVFVGKDDAGKSRFACMRSIGGNLKKDVVGSDKRFSFCYPPQNSGSRQLAVFEAPIDALSHATLQELEGWKWDGYRLSLGGTSPVALVSFLERHPEIHRVTLYMDNDLAGLVNARKIKDLLENDKRFKHIRVGINPPRTGKDYNEKLLVFREQQTDRQLPSRRKQAAVSI